MIIEVQAIFAQAEKRGFEIVVFTSKNYFWILVEHVKRLPAYINK